RIAVARASVSSHKSPVFQPYRRYFCLNRNYCKIRSAVKRAHNDAMPTLRRLAILPSIAVLLLVLPRLGGAQAPGSGPVPDPRAKTLALTDQMPFESAIIRAKLPNGLRYYVRANPKPERRAELRLVVKAGSILEEDDQQELAHVVEHMAFNGTRHFPKQET